MLEPSAKQEMLTWLATMGKRQELRDNPAAASLETALIEEALFTEGARTEGKVRAVFHHLKTRDGLLYWPNAPQIKAGVRAMKAGDAKATQGATGDRSQLSTDEQRHLEEKILPAARRWLEKPGLRAEGIRVLEFWGEPVA